MNKSFRRMERFFWIFFAVVLTFIITGWIFYGYVVLYVLDNPESVGRWIGKLIGGIAG